MISEYLSVGFTQNIIQRIDGRVIKSGKTVEDEGKWYEAYQDKGDIPGIIVFSKFSITMDFIENGSVFDLQKVIDLVEKYRHYPVMNKLKFPIYYERILRHIEQSGIDNAYHLLEKLREIKLEPTFAHGDLSTKNIIFSSSGPKLIDPLYGRNFGSYILDYAKLLFTLKFYEGDIENFDKLKAFVNYPEIDVLIACECIRVATYNRKFDFVAENLIKEL